MNSRTRPALIGCLGMLAAMAAAPVARAEFPARPIKLVIPYAAGGPTDIFGRLLAEYLGKDLKQTVIVENKGGAQGAIAAEMVAHAEPDGYTLFGTSGSVIVLNPLLYKKLPYDPARDFRMLALVTDVPVVLCVNPSVPARTVAEFVAYAKQNPGKLNFGSSGTGSFTHLAAEMFKQVAGIQMTHVPYKGAAPALTDVMSGNIQLMFEFGLHGAAADTIRKAAAARHRLCTAAPGAARCSDHCRKRLWRIFRQRLERTCSPCGTAG